MKEPKKRPFYQTIRAIVGGMIFAYCYIFVFRNDRFSFLLSLFYTLLSLILIYIVIKPKQVQQLDLQIENKEQREAFKQLLEDGKKIMKHIEDLRRNLPYDHVKKQIGKLLNTANEIILYLQKNPLKIQPARKFFTYYLPTFETLVVKYVELSSQNIQTTEIANAKRDISQTLDLLNPSFERQFSNLLQNEILDLDAEIAVLKSTIRLEE